MLTNPEWLFVPAIGTALIATFVPRAAVGRGYQAAPLALMAMGCSLLLTLAFALITAPAAMREQLTHPAAMRVALWGGAAGGLGLCCVYAALKQRATGPVMTIASMSILMPIVMGYGMGWDSKPNYWCVAGVVLTVVGTLAINYGKSPRFEGERFHWLPLALGAVLCYGVSQTAQKYINILEPQAAGHGAPRYGFMVGYYIAAMLGVGGYLAWSGQRIRPSAWPFAAALGAGSLTQFFCMLALLQSVPTSRVYITFTGGSMILILLISAFLLRERYKPAVWVGCVLGLAGVILVRYKPPDKPSTSPPRAVVARLSGQHQTLD